MKNLAIWTQIQEALENNIPVALLYVLESKGSSPGRQGFCMAVTGNGKMEGSIGGGIMEHKLVEMARDMLRSEGAHMQSIKKQVHDKKAKQQSGMICSGEQTVWIYMVEQSEKEVVLRLINSLKENRGGTLMLSSGGIDFSPEPADEDFALRFHSEQDWQYRERTGYKNELCIIGGGHCSLALSKLMRTMDFYIRVFEERAGLFTLEKNEHAHEKQVLEDFGLLDEKIPSGKNRYVVIMSFGYRSDERALRALMHKTFRFIGLLGSKKKIEQMFEQMRTSGVEESILRDIHAPVGIPIKSETPEEIAISIAAQIIQVKNGEKK